MATELDKQPTTLQQRLTCDSKVLLLLWFSSESDMIQTAYSSWLLHERWVTQTEQ